MTEEFIITIFVCFIAGLMRGFTGAGSSMLMGSIFVHIYSPLQTVAIIIFLELLVSAQMLPTVYKKVQWKVILPMGLIAICFMPIGSWVLVSSDPELIAKSMGAIVIIFALILLLGLQYSGPKPLPATLGVGALSGFLMAVTSFGGPPVLVYLLSSKDNSATNRANITGYFSLTLLALTIQMFFSDLISWSTFKIVLILLPIYMISIWAGSRMFQKSNEQLYRRITIGLLIIAGIYGVLQ